MEDLLCAGKVRAVGPEGTVPARAGTQLRTPATKCDDQVPGFRLSVPIKCVHRLGKQERR